MGRIVHTRSEVRIRAACVLLAVAAALGCRDSAAPPPATFSGVYHSVSVDGSRIPVRSDPYTSGLPTLYIRGITVDFSDPDTAWFTLNNEIGSDPSAPTDTSSQVWWELYQVAGDSVIFDNPGASAHLAGPQIRLSLEFEPVPSDPGFYWHTFLLAQ